MTKEEIEGLLGVLNFCETEIAAVLLDDARIGRLTHVRHLIQGLSGKFKADYEVQLKVESAATTEPQAG